MGEPLDKHPYPQHSRSQPLTLDVENGVFVYVLRDSIIHVLPDGPHRHPKILGNGHAVDYAGDLTMKQRIIIDLTNLSGTFICDAPDGLLQVAHHLEQLGFIISEGGIRYFPHNGSRPQILN